MATNSPFRLIGTTLTDLVRKISATSSKQMEETILAVESLNLKQKISERNVSSQNNPTQKTVLTQFSLYLNVSILKQGRMREYLIGLIYCEMLGHSVREVGTIHAIGLTQNAKTILEKRTGYLAASLFLRTSDHMTIMLVNSLIRDLKSPETPEIEAALILLSKIASKEMVPIVVGLVTTLVEHSSGLIRKKAVQVLHRFHIQNELVLPQLTLETAEEPNISDPKQSIQSIFADPHGLLLKLFNDPDQSVVNEAIGLLEDLACTDPREYIRYTAPISEMVTRLADGRAPKGLVYHGVMAPWTQIACLRVLRILGGGGGESTCHQVLPAVLCAAKKADHGVDAAYAITHEAVQTLSDLFLIHPRSLNHYAKNIRDGPWMSALRLLHCRNWNLRYLGLFCVEKLWHLVGNRDGDDEADQMVKKVVVDSVGSGDCGVQVKALQLLKSVLKSEPVLDIAEAVLNTIRQTADLNDRKSLVGQLCVYLSHTEQPTTAAASQTWVVFASLELLKEAGHLVPKSFHEEIALRVKLDAENSYSSSITEIVEHAVLQLRQSEKRLLKSGYVEVISLILGDYAHCTRTPSESLSKAAESVFESLEEMGDLLSRPFLLTAALKILSRLKTWPAHLVHLLRNESFADSEEFNPNASIVTLLENYELRRKEIPRVEIKIPSEIRHEPYPPPERREQTSPAQSVLVNAQFEEMNLARSQDLNTEEAYSSVMIWQPKAARLKIAVPRSGQIKVHIEKLLRPDCVVASLGCQNSTDRQISDIRVDVKISPSYYMIRWRVAPRIKPLPDSNQNGGITISERTLRIDYFRPSEMIVLALEIRPKPPYYRITPDLQFSISVHDGPSPTVCIPSVSIFSSLDFLRPSNDCTVDSFGEMWTVMPAEWTMTVSGPRVMNLYRRLRKEGKAWTELTVVQVIDEESILIARVLDSDDLCLLHFQFSTVNGLQKLYLTVKADELDIAQAVAEDLAARLQSK